MLATREHNDRFADSTIEAPPSFKPAKKYSDLSGLPVSFGFDFCLFIVKVPMLHMSQHAPTRFYVQLLTMLSCDISGEVHRSSDEAALRDARGIPANSLTSVRHRRRLPGAT